jgi:hypothetical protein
MRNGISSVERAFQLARTGEHDCVRRVKMALRDEGYNAYQVQGPILSGQLTKIINATKKSRDPPEGG